MISAGPAGSDDRTLPARVLICLATFEAALGVVLTNTERPVSREYQSGTPSSSRTLRPSSMILTDKGLTRIVTNLPVIVIAGKFIVSTLAGPQIFQNSFL